MCRDKSSLITRLPHWMCLWVDVWRSSNYCDVKSNSETDSVDRSLWAEFFIICHNSNLWGLVESICYTAWTDNVKGYWTTNYSRLLCNMCHADRTNSVVPPYIFSENHHQIFALFHRLNFINMFVILCFNDMNCTLTTPNINNNNNSVLRRINSNVFCWGCPTHRVTVAAAGLYCVFSIHCRQYITKLSYLFLTLVHQLIVCGALNSYFCHHC